MLADAGHWHTEQIERLNARGLAVLIPPDAKKRKGERPGWQGGLNAVMRTLLATETGGRLYTRRNVMIEPVFAHTKFNRGIDRFQRRGRAAARSEWRLITAATSSSSTATSSTPARPEPRQRRAGVTPHCTKAKSNATRRGNPDPLSNSHHATP